MKTVHLFRHGQVDGPAALYGKTDVPLSIEGREQLIRAANQLAKPDCIVSSPLKRCLTFAREQSVEFNSELLIDAGLQEMNFGLWDGVPYSQHSPHWAEMTEFWNAPADITPPDGEALQTMQGRVRTAWENILELPAEDIWVISHGGAIRLLLAHVLQMDWRNPRLYSTLSVGYASRTVLTISYFANKSSVQVRGIAIPPPPYQT